MIKTILLMAIVAMTINCGNAQTNLKMTEKKIKIRNSQVEINYYQQGKGDTIKYSPSLDNDSLKLSLFSFPASWPEKKYQAA